jgi:hypothetical protein
VYEVSVNESDFVIADLSTADHNLTAIDDAFERVFRQRCGSVAMRDDGSVARLASDGQLIVYDGEEVEMVERGFCIEWAVDMENNETGMTAFFCKQPPPKGSATSAPENPEKPAEPEEAPASCLDGFDYQVVS